MNRHTQSQHHEAVATASNHQPNAAAAAVSQMPPLLKQARVDLDGEPPVFEVMQIRRGSKVINIAVPRSAAKNKTTLRNTAYDAGADLPEVPAQAMHVVNEVIAAAPQLGDEGSIVTRWGWYADGETFLINNASIGTPEGHSGRKPRLYYVAAHFDGTRDFNVLGPEALSSSSDGIFPERGTLAEWQSLVAPLGRWSATLRLTAAAALAAPLLAICQKDPFLICLTGRTSKGKTTAELFAGSITGRATPSSIYNWKATEARLEELARYHNDSLLVLDDIATAGKKDVDRFTAVRDTVHWMSGSGVRGRQKKAAEGQSGRKDTHRPVRTIILTSFEFPVRELAIRAKQQFEPGVYVRMIDVPIGDENSAGIVDTFAHEGVDKAAFAEALIAKIRARCAKYHGVVYRDWLRLIVADPARARAAVARHTKSFVADLDLDPGAPEQGRHASHFAFLYAVLAYAIERNLLPWSLIATKWAILKLHGASLERLRGSEAGVRDGIGRLRARLFEAHRFAPWPSSGRPTVQPKTDGWIRTKGASRYAVVRGDVFRSYFASDSERDQVVRQLCQLKAMRSGKTDEIRISGSQQQKLRCYTVDLSLVPPA